MAQLVKNITSIKYFLKYHDIIDKEYNIKMQYHPKADSEFTSLPTFVAEFKNCSVNSLPVLVTEDRHLVTEHLWPMLDKYKHKPKKHHDLWDSWGETIDIRMPPITKQFHDTYKYVWLPIDKDSTNNPWHIWIDVISKFRLIEKRWSTNFAKYIYILSNPSPYFDKVAKEIFPELKYYVMPEGETWRFQHLMAPSMSNHNDGVVTPHLPMWLRHFKGSFQIPENQKPFRKIFVSRDKAHTRKLNNAKELLLALKGWESVTLEDLSIRDQVKIFSEATHVLATHGAGLVNTLWCKEKTKVIEIQDEKMVHKKVYPLLSRSLGLEHELFVAKTLPIRHDGKKPKGVKRLNDLINFDVNIPELIRHLD
tara:strand:- start:2367 stop:3461 length:1095 start_codon:yes stop_codon:yes gene_type:complete